MSSLYILARQKFGVGTVAKILIPMFSGGLRLDVYIEREKV